ncbi:MAG: ABC transporter substrate-binding protein [Hyphomonadaceae bacterium]|nr:ABC transporter substrate-binding protein [Hyphomonadaceae bacterium]
MKILAIALAGMLGAFSAAPAGAWAQTPAPAAPAANAADAAEAKRFVNLLIEQLRAVIARGDLSEVQKQQALAEVFQRNLAVRTMGAILLGQNRSIATPEQLAEYNRLVPGYLARSFADQIDDLVAQNIVLGEARGSGPQVMVSSSFLRRSNKQPVRVVWRVVNTGGRMQLVDASVNGASKLTVQRSEFGALVKANGFEALLAYLRKGG